MERWVVALGSPTAADVAVDAERAQRGAHGVTARVGTAAFEVCVGLGPVALRATPVFEDVAAVAAVGAAPGDVVALYLGEDGMVHRF